MKQSVLRIAAGAVWFAAILLAAGCGGPSSPDREGTAPSSASGTIGGSSSGLDEAGQAAPGTGGLSADPADALSAAGTLAPVPGAANVAPLPEPQQSGDNAGRPGGDAAASAAESTPPASAAASSSAGSSPPPLAAPDAAPSASPGTPPIAAASGPESSASPSPPPAALSPPEPSASPPASAEPAGKAAAKPNRNGEKETLKFSELYADITVRGIKLSDKVNRLNEQKVEMTGFMAPPLSATVRFFVLTKTAMSICPFCSTDADWPSDIVVVFLPEGKDIKPTEHQVKVTGTLSVGSQTDEETGFVSLIRIQASKIEVLS